MKNMEIDEINSKSLAIWSILSKLGDDKIESLEKLVVTEEKTTAFSTFKKSIKEKIFKTIGYRFGIKQEVRLERDKTSKDKLFGKMYMTPSQFLFISLDGKKLYRALPKDLTKAIFRHNRYKENRNSYSFGQRFSPKIDYVSEDNFNVESESISFSEGKSKSEYKIFHEDNLLMNISCWNWTKSYFPFPNYANIIVKIKDREMFFADIIRNNHDGAGYFNKIKSLKKENITYNDGHVDHHGNGIVQETINAELNWI